MRTLLRRVLGLMLWFFFFWFFILVFVSWLTLYNLGSLVFNLQFVQSLL